MPVLSNNTPRRGLTRSNTSRYQASRTVQPQKTTIEAEKRSATIEKEATFEEQPTVNIPENEPEYYQIGTREIPVDEWNKTPPEKQFEILKEEKQIPANAEYVAGKDGAWGYTSKPTIPKELQEKYEANKEKYEKAGKPVPVHYDETQAGYVSVISYKEPEKVTTYAEPAGTHIVFRKQDDTAVIDKIVDAGGNTILKAENNGNFNIGEVYLAVRNGKILRNDAVNLIGEEAYQQAEAIDRIITKLNNYKIGDGYTTDSLAQAIKDRKVTPSELGTAGFDPMDIVDAQSIAAESPKKVTYTVADGYTTKGMGAEVLKSGIVKLDTGESMYKYDYDKLDDPQKQYANKHGIDALNKSLVEPYQESFDKLDKGQQQTFIYESFPSDSRKDKSFDQLTESDQGAVLGYYYASIHGSREEAGLPTKGVDRLKGMAQLAGDLLIPFYWTRNWDDYSTGEKIIYSALDTLFVVSVLAKPVMATARAIRPSWVHATVDAGKAGKAQKAMDEAIKAAQSSIQFMNPQKSNAAQYAIKQSYEADMKFINSLNKLKSATPKELKILEQKSGMKGLKSAIIDVGKAQYRLKAAWGTKQSVKQLAKQSPDALILDTRRLARVEKAQSNLNKSIAKLNTVVDIRYKPPAPPEIHYGERSFLAKLKRIQGEQTTAEITRQRQAGYRAVPMTKQGKTYIAYVNVAQEVPEEMNYLIKREVRAGEQLKMELTGGKPTIMDPTGTFIYQTPTAKKTNWRAVTVTKGRKVYAYYLPSNKEDEIITGFKLVERPFGKNLKVIDIEQIRETSAGRNATKTSGGEIEERLGAMTPEQKRRFAGEEVEKIIKSRPDNTPFIITTEDLSAKDLPKIITITKTPTTVVPAIKPTVMPSAKTVSIQATKVSRVTKPVTTTKSKTSPVQIVKGSISPAQKTILKSQVKIKPVTKTGLTTQVATKTATATTTVKAATTTKPPTTTATLPPIQKPPVVKPPITPPPPKTPKTLPLIKVKFKKGDGKTVVRKLRGPVTWQQGIGWWTRWYPYKQTNSDFTIEAPIGAFKAKDSKSAYDTIQTIRGKSPGKIPKFDMGIVDVVVESPPSKPRKGNRASIRFTQDKAAARRNNSIMRSSAVSHRKVGNMVVNKMRGGVVLSHNKIKSI